MELAQHDKHAHVCQCLQHSAHTAVCVCARQPHQHLPRYFQVHPLSDTRHHHTHTHTYSTCVCVHKHQLHSIKQASNRIRFLCPAVSLPLSAGNGFSSHSALQRYRQRGQRSAHVASCQFISSESRSCCLEFVVEAESKHTQTAVMN